MSKIIHNVAIIGSGPAAHTAAIYTARAQLKPILYEGFMAGGIAAGGQLTTTTDIENFPGFPDGIGGSELMDRMRSQSINCGTTIITETVEKVDLSSRPFKIWRENKADDYDLANSLIIATGATAKRMDIEGDKEFWNRGVSACAVCDGPAPIFRNKPLAVIGGGDSACEEANYLTRYASKVYMILRRNVFRASKVMENRVKENPKIEILTGWSPSKIEGSTKVEKLVLSPTEHCQESSNKVLDVNGIFYAIGHKPNVAFLKHANSKILNLSFDSDGYILPKSSDVKATNVDGVFIAGDVTDKKYRQAITAAGMGCQAALECIHFLEAQNH